MLNKFLPFFIFFFIISCTPGVSKSPISPSVTLEENQARDHSTPTPIIPTQQPKFLTTMSEQYIDARLMAVGDSNWYFDINWDGEDAFKYLLKYSYETYCSQEIFQPVSIRQNGSIISIQAGTQITYKECYPEVDLPLINELNPIDYSPDKTQIIYSSTSSSSEAPIKLNQESEGQDGLQNIISVYSIPEKTMKPVLATPLNYYYSWLSDGKHILLEGLAYGDYLGSGVYIVEPDSQNIVTLSTSYSHTEGSVAPSVSLDAKNIFIFENLLSTDGKQTVRVCEKEESAFSYAWSSDSQWGYVFCRSNPDSSKWGTLRRINTQTHEIQDDLLPIDLVIKPVKMSVSPDNQWLVFEWRDEVYTFKEDFGLYLVKLNDR